MFVRMSLCISSLFCVAAFTGCSSAPAPKDRADYAKSLNRYFEGRPMCVWPDQVSFPVQNPTADEIKERGYDALVSVGLLARKQGNSGVTYELTAAGRAAFDRDIADKSTGNFCYGRRKVASVNSARQGSRTTELVDYEYVVPEPADWARNPVIQRAFRQIASELAGAHSATATLLNTTAGWEVAERPPQPGSGERTSSLAKMKAVFAPGS
ncbi:MAG TPA: hypothetical protein VJU82_07965 [Acidobacteriaceae bacterium]|nr:hypothetical protein [Acidobacteriaceae bacterium]